MSTASGSSPGGGVTWTWSPDMFDPLLVPVDLAAHRPVEDLLDVARHGAGFAVAADDAIVDRADRNHLRSGARQERLVGGVQIGPQDVADHSFVAEVACDRHDRTLRDSLERTGRGRRRDDATAANNEDVLAGALAHEALRRQQ